jgi:hypothetical protein
MASMVSLLLPAIVLAQGDDWLENDAFFSRELTDEEKGYTIKLGMTQLSDCSSFGERSVLTMYVHPSSIDVCMGWNHYPNSYPNTSNPHLNSAVRVQCQDGGVSYTQYPDSLDCVNPSLPGGMNKTEHMACAQGFPPTVYTKILDFSGCTKLGFKRPASDHMASILPTLAGKYCGGTPDVLDISVIFNGDDTVDFYHNLIVRGDIIDCKAEPVRINSSTVTFTNAEMEGDCLGDALRTAAIPRDPSKYRFDINTDGTLTFFTDHSEHVLTSCSVFV